MPVVTETFDGILFDMDGTLVDSTQGVIGAWHFFKERYPHIDVEKILDTAHGVRTVDNLRHHCGVTDPDELESEALRFEQEIVNHSSKNGREGIVALPGVRDLCNTLFIPEGSRRWAICTSATRAYATQALKIAGIPHPSNFIAAEDVKAGKPAPDPYLEGAKLLGLDPRRCLVVEDAPAGIASGLAAGCKTLGVITSHSGEAMLREGTTYLVKDLASVSMKLTPNGIKVTMHTVE
ncbi:phosphatase [Fomitiporia mediterranea MF3/22]|uniref:phosphatase n=1 Tax=Fomitiporia mediterranea (strain MF3/22) TaxID=694068 RepID=UPI000440944B|nr:phosphatase [Fomitiporia mediterranea MF3/22]EJD01137.1 phosphatase [Fomitiporia mediterranea MF3/22]